MTHSEYEKAIEADREFVSNELKMWELRLKEATEKVEYWKRQGDAMSAVGARVSLGDTSAFVGNQKSS